MPPRFMTPCPQDRSRRAKSAVPMTKRNRLTITGKTQACHVSPFRRGSVPRSQCHGDASRIGWSPLTWAASPSITNPTKARADAVDIAIDRRPLAALTAKASEAKVSASRAVAVVAATICPKLRPLERPTAGARSAMTADETSVNTARSKTSAPVRSAATRIRLTGLDNSNSRVPAASSPLMHHAARPMPNTSNITGRTLAKYWLFRYPTGEVKGLPGSRPSAACTPGGRPANVLSSSLLSRTVGYASAKRAAKPARPRLHQSVLIRRRHSTWRSTDSISVHLRSMVVERDKEIFQIITGAADPQQTRTSQCGLHRRTCGSIDRDRGGVAANLSLDNARNSFQQLCGDGSGESELEPMASAIQQLTYRGHGHQLA